MKSEDEEVPMSEIVDSIKQLRDKYKKRVDNSHVFKQKIARRDRTEWTPGRPKWRNER